MAPVGAATISAPALRSKALRYSLVSIANTLIGQTTLALLFGVAHWSALVSASVATVVASVPAFLFYRYWVWERQDPNRLRTEVVRFGAVMLVTLLVSSAAADLSESLAQGRTTSRPLQTLIVVLGGGVALLIAWAIRFLLFETLVFNHSSSRR